MWSYNYLCSNELYHYGVLGMKWGVRKSRDSGGTVKRSRKGSSTSTSSELSKQDLAKKLADGKLDVDIERKKIWDDYNRRLKWTYDPNKVEKLYDEADAKDEALEDEDKKQRYGAYKKLYLSGDIKNDVLDAKRTMGEMQKTYSETISDDSPYAKAACEKFLKGRGKNWDPERDAEYDFYENIWMEGNPDYDNALKEYTTKMSSLESKYEAQSIAIGRKVFGEYADKRVAKGKKYDKYTNRLNTYAEQGRSQVNFVIDMMDTIEKY